MEVLPAWVSEKARSMLRCVLGWYSSAQSAVTGATSPSVYRVSTITHVASSFQ